VDFFEKTRVGVFGLGFLQQPCWRP